MQLAGSCLLLAAPVILLLAFVSEPPRATPERYLTGVGILILLLGVMCHALHGSFRRRSR